MRTRPSFLLSLACAALIAACERVGSDAAAEQATVDAVTQLPAVQPLLERMIAAQESVRFQGERHVEAHWQVGTTHYDLQYLERVSADGAGRFSIEPIDLIEPVLPPGQEDLFLAMSHAREGFYWRYRDFRIHNKPNLLRNYVIHDSGAVVKVLGRDCADLTVRRSHDPSLIYELAVDLKSGLVLRSRELARDGTLIGLSEYTSIDFAADLSNVAWHQATVDEQPLADPNAPLEIGTGAHQPSMIEKGFMLLSANAVASTTAPTGSATPNHFAQYVYSDGVEVVFLLYGGTVPPQTTGQPHADDVVQLPPSVGPWQLAIATIRGERAVAMGRLGHSELLDLIASALY